MAVQEQCAGCGNEYPESEIGGDKYWCHACYEERVAELESWKEDALVVMRQWDWAREVAGKRGKLGDNISDIIRERVAELEAVVEKLPKTKDGVPVVGDTTLWFNGMGGPSAITTRIAADFGESAIGPTPIIMRSYSTREAAQEARNAK